MENKKCDGCKETFLPRTNNQRFCGNVYRKQGCAYALRNRKRLDDTPICSCGARFGEHDILYNQINPSRITPPKKTLCVLCLSTLSKRAKSNICSRCDHLCALRVMNKLTSNEVFEKIHVTREQKLSTVDNDEDDV